ncbi:ExeM/NucH family extracellular endonuclease [Nocardioides sp. zg-DK7169]|uniref:ExeM/NucH family extracellular endonuclease n=1 Tax=Nocardioides sp. zg-DK7169 TaxID=2736600 RepID=UPI001555B231|nr:ExeM/NucH family extracellular endonuclease [Nocardioides sp. zg-DK7169]NPC96774.1 ExeM/NucH family extracellular endonuclease [Nocardioides sp. zg-DK7169]
MTPARRGPRRAVAATAALAVAVTGLAAYAVSPASATTASSGLVISEAYGGGGNSGATYTHDFIELHNPTDAPISVDGLSVQYRSNASVAAASGVTPLSGTVPAGGRYLVQQAAGTGGTQALPTPDATGSIAMSGSRFTVWLAQGTEPLNPPAGDVVGTPGVLDLVGVDSNTFETRATSAISNTTSATRTGTDTDDNSVDHAPAAPSPEGTAGVPDPEPEPEPEPETLTISAIQGDGATSPVAGRRVTTSGVVTAAYPSGLFGFFVQEEGSGGAQSGPATASQGVFVYYPRGAGTVEVRPGDRVEVTGTVEEYAGATQVRIGDASSDVTVVGQGAPLAPVTGEWPASAAAKEALEGMLVLPTGPFTVSDTYSTNRYGEVGLARGTTPLVQPTQVADAQDTAAVAAVVADNAARAIVLDDASSVDYTSAGGSALSPAYVDAEAPVRVGAATAFVAPVILTEGGSPSAPTYRFQPTAPVGPGVAGSPATFENTRTDAPDEKLLSADGTPDVKVAAFNVLNYFTTLGDADDDNVGDGTPPCEAYLDRDGDGNNVRGGCAQRGAWDPADLARQQEKIVAAINALDADVVGLMEIENSAVLGEEPDEATESLVAALNEALGEDVWAANPSSSDLPALEEQDVITNAVIYRTDAVRRVGPSRALGALSGDGEAFGNAREPLAQAFRLRAGGKPVLVVVNHFKSKGSGVDDGTGQGSANPDRVAQAEALAAWLPGVQEATGVEATLLLGDFNSYAMEDPLQVLYDAGWTNVETASGNEEYSYSFSGLVGSLDHVLANDAALASTTGVDVWNINAPESIAFEYSRFNTHPTDFHEASPYRSSDHDPVVVGLDLVADRVVKVTPRVNVKHTPRKAVAGRSVVRLQVRVRAGQVSPKGTVTVRLRGRTLEAKVNRGGVAKVRLGRLAPGTVRVVVRYSGNDRVRAARAVHQVRVVRAPRSQGGRG